ncbi:phosphatase PAP2 family protein [Pelotomaculum propionicicum]|uniref:Undecaprenyl-diphosphatase BcrC n=1 Tax=Pelotomaculum propionicicum TaxID=258475 RepID=A0A4Y7RW51_9FIRM|nr:phosphatase PAP2 family protein [Pelotomaculum propionicicum]NLI12274.1 phosphatase PAP2 family protein [Peptococcaceae bacterium]TEB12912.1 Undecaprenyl-diphosphatase BcrC [Pelotomaculum propionicicum]
MKITLQRKQLAGWLPEMLLVLAPLFLFVVLAKEVVKNNFSSIDWYLLSYFHGLANPSLDRIMLFFTSLGSVKFYFLAFPAILLVLVWRRRWWELKGFSLSFLGAVLLNNLLKISFHRIRPNLYLIKESGYSFPSGHAMVTLAFYGMLLFFAFQHIPSRKWRSLMAILAVFVILTIGVSRVYLGVHYPSDVLGSYLAGFSWLVVSIIAIKRLHCKRVFLGKIEKLPPEHWFTGT